MARYTAKISNQIFFKDSDDEILFVTYVHNPGKTFVFVAHWHGSREEAEEYASGVEMTYLKGLLGVTGAGIAPVTKSEPAVDAATPPKCAPAALQAATPAAPTEQPPQRGKRSLLRWGQEIAAHMPDGWQVAPLDPDHPHRVIYLAGPEEMRIRLLIPDSTEPSAEMLISFEFGSRSNHVPHYMKQLWHMRAYIGLQPSAIAKLIRKILPVYRSAFVTATDRKRRADDRERERREIVRRVAEAFDARIGHTYPILTYFGNPARPNGGRGEFRVQEDGRITVTFSDLPEEKTIQLGKLWSQLSAQTEQKEDNT
ncbi:MULTISPECIES: hypothetical protein [Nocardia]|uniref:hypothetical protein n=1 Tax=Nocardia TaxID=1817 RepID=UPI0024539DD3|nr:MULTISPECIES: hypothetical protein [Nocardia]